jgi:hypothetical protein
MGGGTHGCLREVPSWRCGPGSGSAVEEWSSERERVLTVEELFDEVYVGEDHSPAAVALEVQSVEGLSARARG